MSSFQRGINGKAKLDSTHLVHRVFGALAGKNVDDVLGRLGLEIVDALVGVAGTMAGDRLESGKAGGALFHPDRRMIVRRFTKAQIPFFCFPTPLLPEDG